MCVYIIWAGIKIHRINLVSCQRSVAFSLTRLLALPKVFVGLWICFSVIKFTFTGSRGAQYNRSLQLKCFDMSPLMELKGIECICSMICHFFLVLHKFMSSVYPTSHHVKSITI